MQASRRIFMWGLFLFLGGGATDALIGVHL